MSDNEGKGLECNIFSWDRTVHRDSNVPPRHCSKVVASSTTRRTI